jgi:CheY-like chemotaxis protein
MPGKTVLVIEDNPMNMELVTDLLEAAGYQVRQARSAEEGIRLVRAEHPSLILMDFSLPGMDGLSATAVLKSDPATRDIPIIALTAHAMKGDEEKARVAGCAAYITKPIDTRAFPKTIAQFFQSPGP